MTATSCLLLSSKTQENKTTLPDLLKTIKLLLSEKQFSVFGADPQVNNNQRQLQTFIYTICFHHFSHTIFWEIQHTEEIMYNKECCTYSSKLYSGTCLCVCVCICLCAYVYLPLCLFVSLCLALWSAYLRIVHEIWGWPNHSLPALLWWHCFDGIIMMELFWWHYESAFRRLLKTNLYRRGWAGGRLWVDFLKGRLINSWMNEWMNEWL